jgi:hypothetical protein
LFVSTAVGSPSKHVARHKVDAGQRREASLQTATQKTTTTQKNYLYVLRELGAKPAARLSESGAL